MKKKIECFVVHLPNFKRTIW